MVQTHKMKLAPEPFKKIYDGQKTIELRLFDEKRRDVRVNDEIIFTCTENRAFHVRVKVTKLHQADSFARLFEMLPPGKLGYADGDPASPDDMRKYYSEEQESVYGVVGIEFELAAKPYRDLYRFEPFLDRISELWQRVPDTRFGQLINSFTLWLKNNGHGDGFYLEDEAYIRLFTQFMDESTQK